ERISINVHGSVTRTAVAPTDSTWQWVVEAGPHFDIDGQPLVSFLSWVSRETGRRIVYASPSVEAEAASVTLNGSIADLDLQSALAAVLSTTQFRQYDTGDQALIGIALANSETFHGRNNP